jgi:hypothetical protein
MLRVSTWIRSILDWTSKVLRAARPTDQLDLPNSLVFWGNLYTVKQMSNL